MRTRTRAPSTVTGMHLVRRYGLDSLVVLASLLSALDVALETGGGSAPTLNSWLAVPAVALIPLTLLGRRRFPFGAPAALWLFAAALSFVDGRLIVYSIGTYAAGMAASFLLGNLGDAPQGRIGLLVVLGSAAIIVFNDTERGAGEAIFIPVLMGLVWLACFALRKRTVQAESAVAEERLRIARELHDIVGHSVSVMTVQTSAVRRLLGPDQAKEREALESVERTGREALAEMRRLVGVLRDPDDSAELAPQPSLSRIDDLVTHARESGLHVDVSVEGDPVRLPPGVDLAAYRLVQEGLTNALRHAEASRAEVRVHYTAGHVEVEVSDDGRGSDGTGGGGHGLVGMRERVSIYGGELEAGPRAEGGYRLRARLPVDA